VKQSAGLLLYQRSADGEVRVLVVHPSGPYNKNAPYGLPKGEPNVGEALEAAARRETLEEVGVRVDGPVTSLGYVDYTRSRKRVHAWAAELPADSKPHCACWEIDRAELVTLERAREILHDSQRVFIDRLLEIL